MLAAIILVVGIVVVVVIAVVAVVAMNLSIQRLKKLVL